MKSCWLHRAEAAVIFLGSFVLAALVVKNKGYVETALHTIGPWSYPLAILLFAVVASAPFSVTDALAIMNGVIFGPLVGSIVNTIGLICAAMVGYGLALRTAHLLQLDKQIERLPHWIKRYKVGSPAFLVSVRIIPGLGGTLATQTAAAMRVPLFVHVWTMCAIAVPICTVLAIFGDRASSALHGYYETEKHRLHEHMHVPAGVRGLFHRLNPNHPA